MLEKILEYKFLCYKVYHDYENLNEYFLSLKKPEVTQIKDVFDTSVYSDKERSIWCQVEPEVEEVLLLSSEIPETHKVYYALVDGYLIRNEGSTLLPRYLGNMPQDLGLTVTTRFELEYA